MSGREWKPGDVAMVRNEYGVWNLAVCSVKPIGLVWQYGVADSQAPLNAEARPLAVIDFEDREQVGRLADALALGSGSYMERTQAALREFADPTPPKPPEPTGLGAVVEDDKGERWVRCERDGTPWISADGSAFPQAWKHIDAVRVLSEGVQP